MFINKKSVIHLLFTGVFAASVSLSGFAKDASSTYSTAPDSDTDMTIVQISDEPDSAPAEKETEDQFTDAEKISDTSDETEEASVSSSGETEDKEDGNENDKENTNQKVPSFKDGHFPYISGTGAAFRPQENLTRLEFCTVIDNLCDIPDNGYEQDFSDMEKDSPTASLIAKLVGSALIKGYPDGTFKADGSITRAEFVSVMCKLFETEETENSFEDTKDHWAEAQISYAIQKGWVSGYSDGTFRPDANITRAEAVVIFNRILKRSGTASLDMILSSNLRPYYDVQPDSWYYADIMEATTVHTKSGEGTGELWSGFEYTTHGFGNGVVILNNIGYYIDANGQFCSFSPWSFVTLNDKTYYTTSLGNIDVTLSGIVHMGGAMYYFRPDYSILQNGNYNQLYFDGTGKYTCGDAELDALVENALAACTNDSMTFSEKLRASYLYLRDNCRYLSRPHHPRGTTDFVHESAKFMFKNMRGNCYCYAACFLLMARRLGCEDAYAVSGGVGTTNSNHAWVMINSRIYDPELEYAHRYRYAVKKYYDLYNMDINATPFVYYFPY